MLMSMSLFKSNLTTPLLAKSTQQLLPPPNNLQRPPRPSSLPPLPPIHLKQQEMRRLAGRPQHGLDRQPKTPLDRPPPGIRAPLADIPHIRPAPIILAHPNPPLHRNRLRGQQ